MIYPSPSPSASVESSETKQSLVAGLVLGIGLPVALIGLAAASFISYKIYQSRKNFQQTDQTWNSETGCNPASVVEGEENL